MKPILESWRHYLDEVEAMDAITTSQDEVQQSLDYFYNEHAVSKGEREDLGSVLGHDLVKFDMVDGDDILFFLVKDESPKAYVAVGPFEDGYAVGNVRKTKGGGFYTTDFYKELMDRLRGPLYSDSKQTAAGAGIWTRLQEDPDVNVEKVGSEDNWRWKATQ